MKKRLLCVLLLCITTIQIVNAQIKTKVSEVFELTSIVFALAGVPEYCQCAIPSYWHDINTDLTPYELTEPINYIRELNQWHMIGYDAVARTANMLEIKNNTIRLKPQYDISEISKTDSRWNEKLFAKYIKMLNVFYKESNFHNFFTSHSELYDTAQQSMDEHFSQVEGGWFESFFGYSLDYEIQVYLSLTNGPSNYSLQEGVLLGVKSDDKGMPAPNLNTINLLAHEIGHHYANNLLEKWWSSMENPANIIYPYVKEQMSNIAYSGAYVTIGEWLNRLIVLMYLKDTNNILYKSTIAMDVESGFVWMDRSVEFMCNFYNNRNLYSHIDDFMPQIVSFLNYTADNFELVIQGYENRRPYIVNVYPAEDSDISGFNEIVITFSEPMMLSWGFNGSGSDDKNVHDLFLNEAQWSEDGTKIKLLLNPKLAKTNTMYGIQLHPSFFRSRNCYTLDKRCINLTFNTIQK